MRRVEGRSTVDVSPDKPWSGSLIALLRRAPKDRPVHFRGWIPVHPIYDGQMVRWEVRWYEKGTES